MRKTKADENLMVTVATSGHYSTNHGKGKRVMFDLHV